jgi:hypothetical protein
VTTSAETSSAPAAAATRAGVTAPLVVDRPRRRARSDGDRWSRWSEGDEQPESRVA